LAALSRRGTFFREGKLGQDSRGGNGGGAIFGKNPREEVWTTQERMAAHFGALQGSNGKEGPRVPVGVFEEDAKDKRVVLTNIYV